MTTADILNKAADILSEEGAWTKHVFARDELGHPVDVNDEFDNPVCFCLYGAIGRAANLDPEYYRDADPFLQAVLGVRTPGHVAEWNDDPKRTQAEVIQALRDAAILSRSSENRNG